MIDLDYPWNYFYDYEEIFYGFEVHIQFGDI